MKSNLVRQQCRHFSAYVWWFVVIVYFLFGDLSVMEHFDIISLMTYLQKHMEVMYAVQILFPVVAMLFYYISYRISVKLVERREWEDE